MTTYFENGTIRIVQHPGQGFFSCCTIQLQRILTYFNTNHVLPLHVDSTEQFLFYKTPHNFTTDIKSLYFDDSVINNVPNFSGGSATFEVSSEEAFSPLPNSSGDLRSPSELVVQRLTSPLPESDTDINITDLETEEQYSDFTHLNHTKLAPFLKRYFSPSNEIESIIDSIEYKYNIQYENTCVLFFRGNDKCTEMELPSYTQYILAAEQILKQHPNIRFLVQSDETEFLETMVSTFPNSVVFFDEIRHMRRNVNTVDRVFKSQNANMSLFYLAITYIMSRCKHIIFNRGNCSLWIALFRGNSDNIIQLFA
jgi:uncharacterized protein (DUF1330 family)